MAEGMPVIRYDLRRVESFSDKKLIIAITAKNGREGVETAVAEKPDLILMSPSSGAAVIRNCYLKNQPVNKFAT
jgi:hypothetical protein